MVRYNTLNTIIYLKHTMAISQFLTLYMWCDHYLDSLSQTIIKLDSGPCHTNPSHMFSPQDYRPRSPNLGSTYCMPLFPPRDTHMLNSKPSTRSQWAPMPRGFPPSRRDGKGGWWKSRNPNTTRRPYPTYSTQTPLSRTLDRTQNSDTPPILD